MNKEVNFEIAKLLKDKGFEGTKSPLWYYKDGTLNETPTVGYEGLKCWNTWEATQGVRWDAPTIAEVVMWLHEKHGIWIGVTKYKNHVTDVNDDCYFTPDNGRHIYKTPTEAYEARINFTLENIK